MRRRPRDVPGKPASSLSRPGLPRGLVEDLVRRQGGLCAVCRARPATHADHDHALARLHPHPDAAYCVRCLRAVLCNSCNSMVGFAADSPEVLEAGAAYVRAWRERRR